MARIFLAAAALLSVVATTGCSQESDNIYCSESSEERVTLGDDGMASFTKTNGSSINVPYTVKNGVITFVTYMNDAPLEGGNIVDENTLVIQDIRYIRC